MNLAKNVKFVKISGYKAAGTADSTQEAVCDMAGYDGVCFIASVSAVTAGGLLKLIPSHSSATSTTDQVSLSSTAYGGGFAGSSADTTGMTDMLIVADVYRPTKRYLSAVLDLGTANVAVDSVVAMQYRNRKGPVTQSTATYGVVDADVFISPTSA